MQMDRKLRQGRKTMVALKTNWGGGNKKEERGINLPCQRLGQRTRSLGLFKISVGR